MNLHYVKWYFDFIEIRKVLTKIAKEKGNESISDWIKPCKNHLYWSATSTHDGNGVVIWAKFKAFLSHIVNKHKDLDDPVLVNVLMAILDTENGSKRVCIGQKLWLPLSNFTKYETMYTPKTVNILIRRFD